MHGGAHDRRHRRTRFLHRWRHGGARRRNRRGSIRRSASLTADAWRELRRSPLFIVSSALIIIMVLMAAFPRLFTRQDPRFATWPIPGRDRNRATGSDSTSRAATTTPTSSTVLGRQLPSASPSLHLSLHRGRARLRVRLLRGGIDSSCPASQTSSASRSSRHHRPAEHPGVQRLDGLRCTDRLRLDDADEADACLVISARDMDYVNAARA